MQLGVCCMLKISIYLAWNFEFELFVIKIMSLNRAHHYAL